MLIKMTPKERVLRGILGVVLCIIFLAAGYATKDVQGGGGQISDFILMISGLLLLFLFSSGGYLISCAMAGYKPSKQIS